MPTAAGVTALVHVLLLGLAVGSTLRPSQPIRIYNPHVQEADGGPSPSVEEGVRRRRQMVQRLVLSQPHLVHDMGPPEVRDTSGSQFQTETSHSSYSSQTWLASQDVARSNSTGNDKDVVEVMERMVHLHPPEDLQDLQGTPNFPDPETELRVGPGAAESSLEASGFLGIDTEDRDRGDDGEERERRGGGEERGLHRAGGERGEEGEDGEDDQMLWEDLEETNHTRPNLDALIGYSPSLFRGPISTRRSPDSSPAMVHHTGLEELPTALVSEAAPLERGVGEGEGQASGNGLYHSSITMMTTTSSLAPAEGPERTAPPEAATGTDFALLGYADPDSLRPKEDDEVSEEGTRLSHLDTFTQNPTVPEVGLAPSRRPLQPGVEEGSEERGQTRDELLPPTIDHASTVSFSDLSWERMGLTTPPQTKTSEVRGGEVTEFLLPEGLPEDVLRAQQVVCVDWSELVGRGYVILNISHNMNCEEFCVEHGVMLLDVLEHVFARRMNSPEGSWILYLSKPTHQQQQLLMNVASEHGVIATKDVLQMLGEVRKSLNQMGILDFSAASSCPLQPSQSRSDYRNLFVVLVIIGSVCVVIITSGLIYICWQKRLLATKTMSQAEELHFVENACHDNPTLDVTNDSQPEMQEKKPSTNGLTGSTEQGGADGNRWQVFVNQAGSEEEEDTHL